MKPYDSDFDKYYRWLETLVQIPFNKYKGLSGIQNHISGKPKIHEIKEVLENTKNCLDSAVYGHCDTKNQIVRFVAQWVMNKNSNGLILGIQGAKGCGKTSISKNGISKAFNLPFINIPLGGVYDVSYLDGHGFTYTGSTYGKIIQSIIHAQCSNPVFYFDELDKVGKSYKGGDVSNLLIHLTDPLQNCEYTDKYFSEFPVDLSKSIMIFTYNDASKINPILLDRMITINIKDYSIDDKVEIANQYLLPSISNQFNLQQIISSKKLLRNIIFKTTQNEGIRDIRRILEFIISHINLNTILNNEYNDIVELNKFDINDLIQKFNSTQKNNEPFLHSLYS